MLCLNNLGLIHIPCDILYTQGNQFVTDFERQRCNTDIMLLRVHNYYIYKQPNENQIVKREEKLRGKNLCTAQGE